MIKRPASVPEPRSRGSGSGSWGPIPPAQGEQCAFFASPVLVRVIFLRLKANDLESSDSEIAPPMLPCSHAPMSCSLSTGSSVIISTA